MQEQVHFVIGLVIAGTLEPNPRNSLNPTQIVFSLIQPTIVTKRNFTGDHYFSSIKFGDELKTNGITYFGTIRANKVELPFTFLPNKKKREVFSIKFAFKPDNALVSYVPK